RMRVEKVRVGIHPSTFRRNVKAQKEMTDPDAFVYHPPDRSMYPHDDDLEQRLARFEAQLDRFSLGLHQWQRTQDHGQSANPRDLDQRLRTLEETLDREAHAVRQLHEEPLRQLQAQTAILKELCAAAATSVQGLDQAEARLAALHADVQ